MYKIPKLFQYFLLNNFKKKNIGIILKYSISVFFLLNLLYNFEYNIISCRFSCTFGWKGCLWKLVYQFLDNRNIFRFIKYLLWTV